VQIDVWYGCKDKYASRHMETKTHGKKTNEQIARLKNWKSKTMINDKRQKTKTKYLRLSKT
jgi:hypothetical protein